MPGNQRNSVTAWYEAYGMRCNQIASAPALETFLPSTTCPNGRLHTFPFSGFSPWPLSLAVNWWHVVQWNAFIPPIFAVALEWHVTHSLVVGFTACKDGKWHDVWDDHLEAA